MTPKITLITPPDFFQNDSQSVIFIDLIEEEQDAVTKWLLSAGNINLNIYYYQGELDLPWLLHSYTASDYRYINVANISPAAGILCSYLLSKPNSYYSAHDELVTTALGHINHNRVKDAVDFLERIIDGKVQEAPL